MYTEQQLNSIKKEELIALVIELQNSGVEATKAAQELQAKLEAQKVETAAKDAQLKALMEGVTKAVSSNGLLIEHEGQTYKMKTKSVVYELTTYTFAQLSKNPELVGKLLADPKQNVLQPA